MAEEQTPNNDAQGGGQQPETPGRVFTQAELDAVITQRLQREREKYADYEALKTAASKLHEIEDAQKTELEKAQDAQRAAEQAAQEAIHAANERLMRAAFIAAAAQAGAAYPEDAFALASRGGVTIGDDGTVTGVAEAVAALVAAGRLVMQGKPVAPNTDGGAGGGERRTDQVQLSPEQLEMARKMRIKPEEYAKFIQKIN